MVAEPRDAATKVERLRASRTFHPHPERVQDHLFLTNEFFDRRDLLQVRYEMARRVFAEGLGVASTARDFGVSRPTIYQVRRRFKEGGLAALLNLRPGPKGSRKVRGEVLRLAEELRASDHKVPYREISRTIQEKFGVSVDPSTLLRALQARGKKLGPKRTRTLHLSSRRRR